VPQYEISDCGMVIEIELRQLRIEALITLDPPTVQPFESLTALRRIEG
jgi:hypothetical protein